MPLTVDTCKVGVCEGFVFWEYQSFIYQYDRIESVELSVHISTDTVYMFTDAVATDAESFSFIRCGTNQYKTALAHTTRLDELGKVALMN